MVPADRLLIETDSPYLAPVPYRGKTNNPSYVVHVAQQIAELRGTTAASVAEVTSRLEAAGETVFRIGAIVEGPKGCTVKGSAETWSAREDWEATHIA